MQEHSHAELSTRRVAMRARTASAGGCAARPWPRQIAVPTSLTAFAPLLTRHQCASLQLCTPSFPVRRPLRACLCDPAMRHALVDDCGRVTSAQAACAFHTFPKLEKQFTIAFAAIWNVLPAVMAANGDAAFLQVTALPPPPLVLASSQECPQKPSEPTPKSMWMRPARPVRASAGGCMSMLNKGLHECATCEGICMHMLHLCASRLVWACISRKSSSSGAAGMGRTSVSTVFAWPAGAGLDPPAQVDPGRDVSVAYRLLRTTAVMRPEPALLM